MSTNRDTTRVVRSWLDDGVTALPDRVLDAVLEQVSVTPQRRPWLAWRPFTMRNALRIALVAAAAVVLAAVIGTNLLPASDVPGTGGPVVSPPASPSPTPSPSPSPVPADALDEALRADGRYSVTVEGVPLSFSVPTDGWESHGRPYISKSTQGPQGAEAIIYWASFPDGLSAHPCGGLLDASIGQSAVELAAAVATALGTELIAGPSDVMVGERAAQHVVLTVREDVGCDPGFFYTWEPFLMGALWPETVVGDTIRVWVVDVDGTVLFIGGETHPDASAGVLDQVEQIVKSIRFE